MRQSKSTFNICMAEEKKEDLKSITNIRENVNLLVKNRGNKKRTQVLTF